MYSLNALFRQQLSSCILRHLCAITVIFVAVWFYQSGSYSVQRCGRFTSWALWGCHSPRGFVLHLRRNQSNENVSKTTSKQWQNIIIDLWKAPEHPSALATFVTILDYYGCSAWTIYLINASPVFFFVGFLPVKTKLVWLTDSVNQCLLYMSIIIAAFNAVALEITSLD